MIQEPPTAERRQPSLEQLEDPHIGIRGRRLYVIHVRGRGSLSAFGGLYVGQTAQDRHARLAEHDRGGVRAAQGLAGNCRCLRPELYAHLELLPVDESIAMRAEYALADRLADAGFAVQTNGCNFAPRPPRARLLFTAADLRRVALPLRRRLVLDVVGDDPAGAELEHVVHALRFCSDVGYGELHPRFHGRPSLGRLAHVERPAVEDLVEQVLSPYR